MRTPSAPWNVAFVELWLHQDTKPNAPEMDQLLAKWTKMLSDFSILTAQLRFPARFFGDVMNSSYLRAGAALACAVALSACGGSDGQLILGGTYQGVTKTGLVVKNGGQEKKIDPPANGSGAGQWSFDNLISTDDRYTVEFVSKPSNVKNCTIENASGRAGYHVYTVYITCELNRHALSGSVSNLKGNLVLVNGSDKVTVPAGATGFRMADVAEDSPYGVAILEQPAGQTCTVANGSGTVGPAAVTNVAVTCTP
jgi:hypothetical protein